MPRDLRPFEKRKFGRRQTLWHAWVKEPGRQRVPCVVRNFSLAGALLEFDRAPPMGNRFRLTIDVYEFQAECYVRHRSRNAIGANFDELATVVAPSHGATAADLVDLLQQEGDGRTH